MRQVLQWVFLYLHIHLHQHDAIRHVPCVPRASLESVPILHPPSLALFCPLCLNMAAPVNSDKPGMLTAPLTATRNMQVVVCACMRVNLCIMALGGNG